MTKEEDYFGWADASDDDGIPSIDDDFAQIDDMPPRDDDSQIDKLPDDLGMEHSSQPVSEDASMSMLLKAAGWHPFLHLFVRISNMLYGNYREWQRPAYSFAITSKRFPRPASLRLSTYPLPAGITLT